MGLGYGEGVPVDVEGGGGCGEAEEGEEEGGEIHGGGPGWDLFVLTEFDVSICSVASGVSNSYSGIDAISSRAFVRCDTRQREMVERKRDDCNRRVQRQETNELVLDLEFEEWMKEWNVLKKTDEASFHTNESVACWRRC